MKKNRAFYWRFAKFVVVGGFTTIFGLFLYYLFIKVFSVNIYISYVAVFLISVFFSTILNSIFNYKTLPSLGMLIVFYRSYLFGFMVGFVMIFILQTLFPGLDEFVVAVLTIPVRTMLTFLFVDRSITKKDNIQNDL